MARHRLGTVRFGLVALSSLALLGCQQGTTGGGSLDARGTGIETGGGQQEPGRPSPEACLSPDAVGATTPTGEVFFPPEGATVGLGEVAFLWSASDREDNNLLVTIQVSDQPDVFGAPAASERVCTASQTGLGRTPITFTAAGVFYWGMEITDGVNTIQRPADGVGVRFEVSPQGPGARRGIEDAILLCPRDTLPARAATTFQWVLGDVQPTRTQVFVSRAGRESPFDSPLRVFEVTPPTAASLAISEADALPLGVELSWGLRMETTQAVLFTFEGQLGASFVVEDNVPPSGVLLGPEDGAVWADHTEVFPLSWDADPGNCEDGLTSTVYFELLNGADQPTNLFNSPLQLEVGQASLEVNLVAESQELSLGGGLWAWGVLADDGTDVAELGDSADPDRFFRTFIRNTAPRFAEAPQVAVRSCGSGPPLAAIAFAGADDNGAETVTVTVTYATTQAAVFATTEATQDFALGGSGPAPVDGAVFLEFPGVAGCTEFIRGSGFYGLELNDGVNDPVRRIVAYTAAGACCAADGSCSEVSPDECDGLYQGDGTSCATVTCPAPEGACCLPNGTCTEGPSDECVGGVYQGDGTTCADTTCPGPPPPQITDCNNNGIDDAIDIAAETSEDCQPNSIPDECDIAAGTSLDCNTNGRPDECDEIPERLHVDVDVAVPGDGSSWADAYDNLQDALGAASDVGATEIWVAAGTYWPTTPAGERYASFYLRDGVAVYGGFAGNELCRYQRNPVANPTILSGDFNTNGDISDNSYRVVSAVGVGPVTVLDGFIITAGNADGSGEGNTDSGAGLYCGNGSPTVTNCRLTENQAVEFGGGMYIDGGSPTVTGCVFEGNSGGQGGGGGGGGLYSNAGSPTLTDCVFDANQGGGYGGGAYLEGGLPVVSACEFRDNAAIFHGGGLGTNTSTLTVADCIFTGNSSGAVGQWGDGGGMYVLSGQPTLVNCLFANNAAQWGDGGGLHVTNDGGVTVINCTLVGNTATLDATGRGGGIYANADITVTNSILWGNSDDAGTGEFSQIYFGEVIVVITYSCIQDDLAGDGNIPFGGAANHNIDSDPLFAVGAAYRLSAGSPCIDAGDNTAVPAGVTTDLDGRPRIVDGNGDGEPVVDMGAYEF